MLIRKLVLSLGFLAHAVPAIAADMPDATETVRYLSSYLADPKDELRLAGDTLIYDKDRKCAYDVKIPLLGIKPGFGFANDGEISELSLVCQLDGCMRRFATCDHRVNQSSRFTRIKFAADKEKQAAKAFMHLLRLLNTKDPFE